MSKLDTSTILHNAQQGISNWNSIRNDSTKMIPLFAPNHYLSFPKTSFEIWSEYLRDIPENEQRIHVYVSTDSATNPTKLNAYMLDSVTDSLNLSHSQTQYNNSLHMSGYHPYDFSNNRFSKSITPVEAHERIKRWNNNYTTWLDYQQNHNMPQVFAVPFSDLKALLGGDTSAHSYVALFFALAHYPVPGTPSAAKLNIPPTNRLTTEGTFHPQDYYLEFILYRAVHDEGSGKHLDKNAPEDIICPAPPFNNYTGASSQYQLLP